MRSLPWDSFSFFLDILCIKCLIAYFIVSSFIAMVSKKGDHVFVQGWQALEQSLDDNFVSYRYLQASEMIHKCLNRLVDVVQQVVIFLYLVRKELVAHKVNVGQNPHLMNVAKGLPCLRWSFATLHIHKLIVHEVECNNGHYLLDMPFVNFLHFRDRHWKVEIPWIRPQCPKSPQKPTPSPIWISKY